MERVLSRFRCNDLPMFIVAHSGVGALCDGFNMLFGLICFDDDDAWNRTASIYYLLCSSIAIKRSPNKITSSFHVFSASSSWQYLR